MSPRNRARRILWQDSIKKHALLSPFGHSVYSGLVFKSAGSDGLFLVSTAGLFLISAPGQRALCSSCIARFADPLCESCVLRNNSNVAREMYAGLAATAMIFLASTWFFARIEDSSGQTALPLSTAALIGALFSCTHWGWKFLSNYFPTLWFGTGIVWLIYVIVKFIASYFIGLIVGPFQIMRMLNQIRIVSRVKHQIASGEL